MEKRVPEEKIEEIECFATYKNQRLEDISQFNSIIKSKNPFINHNYTNNHHETKQKEETKIIESLEENRSNTLIEEPIKSNKLTDLEENLTDETDYLKCFETYKGQKLKDLSQFQPVEQPKIEENKNNKNKPSKSEFNEGIKISEPIKRKESVLSLETKDFKNLKHNESELENFKADELKGVEKKEKENIINLSPLDLDFLASTSSVNKNQLSKYETKSENYKEKSINMERKIISKNDPFSSENTKENQQLIHNNKNPFDLSQFSSFIKSKNTKTDRNNNPKPHSKKEFHNEEVQFNDIGETIFQWNPLLVIS